MIRLCGIRRDFWLETITSISSSGDTVIFNGGTSDRTVDRIAIFVLSNRNANFIRHPEWLALSAHGHQRNRGIFTWIFCFSLGHMSLSGPLSLGSTIRHWQPLTVTDETRNWGGLICAEDLALPARRALKLSYYVHVFARSIHLFINFKIF